MPGTTPCAICETRKPRRACPAVHAEICTLCCATGREETINCPLPCEYLHEAHRHERQPAYEDLQFPNPEIEITESFLEAHEVLVAFVATQVYEAALDNAGSTDWDIRDALQSLIAPDADHNLSPPAASIAARVQSAVAEIRAKELEKSGAEIISDKTLRQVLAFLQRLEYSHNNGRKYCRAFIDFISTFYSPAELEPAIS